MTLRLRPHHLLCALGYQGKGYSDAFTANMTRLVAEGLHAPGGDTLEIELIAGADSLCTPCPHRRGAGCAKEASISALDARHGAALELHAGDILTWGDAKERIKNRLSPSDLDHLCAGCSWLPMGMCRDALTALCDTGAEGTES